MLYNVFGSGGEQFGALNCKRRIHLDSVDRIIVSENSDQFVVVVPSEYDYHFECARSRRAVHRITSQCARLYHRLPSIIKVQTTDLGGYVRTKNGSAYTVPNVPQDIDLYKPGTNRPPVAITDFHMLKVLVHFSSQQWNAI